MKEALTNLLKDHTKIQIPGYEEILFLISPVVDPIQVACGILSHQPSLSKRLMGERKREFL